MIQLLIKVGLAVLIIGGLVSMATNGFGNFESGLDSVCNKKKEVISLFSRFQPIGQFEAAQRSFDRGARLQWGLRLRRVEPAQLHHRGDQGPHEELAKVVADEKQLKIE